MKKAARHLSPRRARRVVPALALFLVAALSAALPVPAAAGDQRPGAPSPPPAREPARPHSFEITVGGEWLMADSLGTAPATMLQNNTASAPYTYFTTSGTRAAAPAFRGGVAYVITPTFTVEGSLLVSRGDVQANISSDAEGVAATIVAERMTQYFIDASVLASLQHLSFSQGAGVPFLEAGGGYLRQVHEGNLAIDTGQIFHVGGGVNYLISTRPHGRLTGIGIRAGARLYIRNKGYNFDNGQRAFAGFGGGIFLAF